MRIRSALAAVAATAALATGISITPAVADNRGDTSAAAWTPTTTLNNGPIRECYAASCDEVWRPGPGETVRWSHHAINPDSNNRWYYVQYVFGNGHPKTVYGWIYCGNVTAPC
ncbi:hypothetical protein [Streptomyces sp. NPDC058155]|uniref:hypothetical protein n=1 Tax=Streptomyces sp. NPDC058155 TaxID=3346359 RepID=UPI0036E76162